MSGELLFSLDPAAYKRPVLRTGRSASLDHFETRIQSRTLLFTSTLQIPKTVRDFQTQNDLPHWQRSGPHGSTRYRQSLANRAKSFTRSSTDETEPPRGEAEGTRKKSEATYLIKRRPPAHREQAAPPRHDERASQIPICSQRSTLNARQHW